MTSVLLLRIGFDWLFAPHLSSNPSVSASDETLKQKLASMVIHVAGAELRVILDKVGHDIDADTTPSTHDIHVVAQDCSNILLATITFLSMELSRLEDLEGKQSDRHGPGLWTWESIEGIHRVLAETVEACFDFLVDIQRATSKHQVQTMMRQEDGVVQHSLRVVLAWCVEDESSQHRLVSLASFLVDLIRLDGSRLTGHTDDHVLDMTWFVEQVDLICEQDPVLSQALIEAKMLPVLQEKLQHRIPMNHTEQATDHVKPWIQLCDALFKESDAFLENTVQDKDVIALIELVKRLHLE